MAIMKSISKRLQLVQPRLPSSSWGAGISSSSHSSTSIYQRQCRYQLESSFALPSPSRSASSFASTATSTRSSIASAFPLRSSPAFRSASTSSSSSNSNASSPPPTSSPVATYAQTGAFEDVIRIETIPLPSLQPDDLLLRFLASPINPADINMIEGVYHIRPQLPAIGGNEGVAEIVGMGEAVSKGKQFQVGDWVIPASPGFGTWRKYAVAHHSSVDKIPNQHLTAEQAATMAINPCSAYRMVHDYTQLQPNDIVIQNGANSSVGQAVIQLCKLQGVHTINIIRDRPELSETVNRLKKMGTEKSIVITEEYASSRHMKELISKFDSKPKLALNCVGGSSSSELSRLLADGGQLITYGGMSKKPVQIPTGRFIFNNIVCRGFWLSQWIASHSREERQEMLRIVAGLIQEGKLQQSVETRPFEQFQQAMARVREPYRDNKVVLTF